MADVRDAARAWIQDNWDPQMTLGAWWQALADAGWAFPHWPKGYGGRDLSRDDTRVVNEELGQAGAVAPPGGLGQMMGGPITIDFGTDEQKDAWLPALASGREGWCQLFSEPGAGSDLASAQTRAVRDGDVWIVNGQKVWTSGATTASRGMLVARTNLDAPKHRGLTYFIIDMDQPGIEIRPLKQMNGGASFNEVFFSDAVVGHDRILGGVDTGWQVAVATLAYERQGLGSRGAAGGIVAGTPGPIAGHLDRTCAELIEAARSERQAAERGAAARTPKAVIRLARDMGLSEDPVVRQRLADLHIFAEVQRYTSLRARAALQAGRQPGPEVSIAKLAASEQARRARDVSMAILGAHGTLLGEDAPAEGMFQQLALSVHASSIAGGTDEIQRNIIGERVLGLPKEPQVDRDVPFKELRTGTLS
ncbi:acyl-CoA dehydrogenase family protein [Actinomarinicola tropica]|uniref:Acyl-CoA dehydrogenase n=1 Tax=Actinomarinicola tropica TaxID=2789776 RepID=A0A5Q2RNS6_9ACTN|nr:acyl-CoA dehydrogenase family protein [Actinomarinicola tropica]QGG95747.1 acyl-CoA dehydrogenase [Actinomarinicola tropica]